MFASETGVVAAKKESDVSVGPGAQNFFISFDGKDDKGDFLPDGVYDVLLTARDKAGNQTEIVFPKLKIDRSAPPAVVKYVDYNIFTPDDGVTGAGDGFKDRTTLNYELSAPAFVKVDIQDSLGRILSSSSDGIPKTAGTFSWDGKAENGFAADGAYIFKITIADEFGNQTLTSIPVIKNTIPAQLKFPVANGNAVGGVVTVKGVALDPGINNTADFSGYEVWFREGGNVDYSQSQNNPSNPDPTIWEALPVPPGNQSPVAVEYPDSTRSVRSIVNGVLATWDTSALQAGAIYTVLLAAKDNAGVVSFDSREVIVDPGVDNNKPVVAITAPPILDPPAQFNLVSETSELGISYSLNQQQDKKADITLEIFKIPDPATKKLGNIVFRKEFLGQTAGGAVLWNGKDYFQKYVDSGDYRIKVTARDTDNIGLSAVEADIKVNTLVTEPFKIEKFEASTSVIAPGGQTAITYRASKEAFITVKVFDPGNTLAQILTDSVQVPAKTDQQVTFTSAQEGLFSIQLDAVSVDILGTKESASLSIAVTGGGTASLAEIVYPPENAVLQGYSNFNWIASGQGEYYPPQTFSSTIRASGKESVTTITPNSGIDTLTGDFSAGAVKKNVDISNDELKLAAGENQSQSAYNQIAPHSACFPRRSAQGIYSIADGTIKRIEFNYYPPCLDRGGGMDVTVELRADAGGLPENVLAQVGLGNLNCRAPGFYGGDFNFDITGQTRYWIVLKEIYLGGSGPGAGIMGTDYDSYGRGEALFNSACNSRWYRGYEAPAFYNIRDFNFLVRMAPFAKSGNFVSRIFDAGLDLDFYGKFEIIRQINSQTINFYTQTSDDGVNFDSPLPIQPGGQIPSAKKRYIKWLADLSTQDQNYSPVIQEVKLNYSNIRTQTVDFAVDKSLPGPFVTFYSHPTLIPESPSDLSTFVPELASKDVVEGPTYNILENNNPNVLQSVTTENGGAQIKAVTSVKESWSTVDDQNLTNGRFGGINTAFNNDPNPENFNVEAPYDFSAKVVRPLVFSSAYPAPDMARDAVVKNKYLFWKNASGQIIDNPYTSVPSGGWGVDFKYMDNAGNPDLTVNKLLEKISNTNADPQRTPINIDDEFSVKMAAGAAPRAFVELRGNTSTESQGFKSYSLAYKKTGELVFHPIKVENPSSPIGANGVLGFWDVTGLNGEYNIKLVVLDANGVRELERKVSIGKAVPGQTPDISLPVFVNAPWNKVFLEFPDDCLQEPSIISITPVKPENLNIGLNSSIPQPIGAVYDLQPAGIKFKDPANNPAYLTVRFTSEEMAGIDPAQLTIYEISSDGVLASLDTKVTFDQNGNGQLDAGEIVTIRSPVRHFSYFMIVPAVPAPQLDALPGITNQESVSVSGRSEANSSVEVFLNGNPALTMNVDSIGKMESTELQLAEGKNIVTARAVRQLNKNIRKYSGLTTPMIVEKDSNLSQVENIVFSRSFRPQLGESNNLAYSLAKEMKVDLVIRNAKDEIIKNLLSAETQVPGKYSIKWGGTGIDGALTAGGMYIFDLNGVDAAGNKITAKFGPFELIKDTAPPFTNILIGQPQYAGDRLYISTSTAISFSSLDDLSGTGDKHGFGVADTKFSINSSAFADYNLPFSVPVGGSHFMSFFSFDIVGNTEPLKNTTFILDSTPPVTTLQINGAQYFDNNSNIHYISNASEIGFVAEDAQVGSLPGSGVKFIEYSLNREIQDFSVYEDTFTLPPGKHLIAFNSMDNVLNKESVKNSSLAVDGLEPLINVSFDTEAKYLSNGVLHVSAGKAAMQTEIIDQPSFGSGIKTSLLEIDGVSENVAPTAVRQLVPGKHHVAVRTEDNLGHKAEKIFEVVVGDLLPPADLKPNDGFITNRSSVTFRWTSPTTTYYSLTEYDLLFSQQENFETSEFEQLVSSQITVSLGMGEAGIGVDGLELHDGELRLITEQVPDYLEGTLEGTMTTPPIWLQPRTTGISGFISSQTLNGGEIIHEYGFNGVDYYSVPTSGNIGLSMWYGGYIYFRSKLSRAALTDVSPVLASIQFTVHYQEERSNYYCHKHCFFCSYHCHTDYYYADFSYLRGVSAVNPGNILTGLRTAGSVVELVTDYITSQSTGTLFGTWLSQQLEVPEQAYRIGDFVADFDSNRGQIVLKFSKNAGVFNPISELWVFRVCCA